jgi:hypothetical protein
MGHGNQTVLWGLEDIPSAGSYARGSMVTFPRVFDGVPSSVAINVLGTDAGAGSLTVTVPNSYANGVFVLVSGAVTVLIKLQRSIVATY